MSAKRFAIIAISFLSIGTVLVLSLGCSKDDPVGPIIPAPVIDIFTASPNDIVPPDSSLITWKARMADSVKLYPSSQKLTPVDSGQIYVKPTIPTTYSLVAYSGGGKDSSAVTVVMTALAANIATFRITPDTLVNGDSSILGWRTRQADSIVINQGIGRVNPSDTGKITIFPMNTATYRAIAYSIYGNDTILINVRVKKPVLVRAMNGSYYKGVMGSTQLSPALRFAVADAASNLLDNLWIKLRVLQGDGVLSPTDSVLTNSMGIADVTYDFDGLLGHAVISGNFRSIDTVDVYLRANTLIPGVGGQGQYILFSELYSDVKNYNGNPVAEAEDPFQWLCYADYEAALHTVFVIQDTNHTGFPENIEHVYAIILTSGYTGKTRDSIGIGTTYNEIKAVYGSPDTIIYDPTPPPALVFFYDALGMVFFTDTVTGSPLDTNETVFEIHMSDLVSRRVAAKVIDKEVLHSKDSPINYRRFRK